MLFGCSNVLFHQGFYCRINLRVLTNPITKIPHCLNTADFVHNPVISLKILPFDLNTGYFGLD